MKKDGIRYHFNSCKIIDLIDLENNSTEELKELSNKINKIIENREEEEYKKDREDVIVHLKSMLEKYPNRWAIDTSEACYTWAELHNMMEYGI